jgi:hypothetical protein
MCDMRKFSAHSRRQAQDRWAEESERKRRTPWFLYQVTTWRWVGRCTQFRGSVRMFWNPNLLGIARVLHDFHRSSVEPGVPSLWLRNKGLDDWGTEESGPHSNQALYLVAIVEYLGPMVESVKSPTGSVTGVWQCPGDLYKSCDQGSYAAP